MASTPADDDRRRDHDARRTRRAEGQDACPRRSRARARCWSRWRRPASTGPTWRSAWAPIRRRPGIRRCRVWRSPARWRRSGAGVTRWKAGDKVCALVNGGGYAEYCLAEETDRAADPGRASTWSRPAAVPETFFTVWNNVFERGRLAAGEWFLVHGGSSGIGTTAIQLAKAFGAKVIATAGSADKCKACLRPRRRPGHQLQDARTSSPPCKEATGGKGVDVTLDMVGGDYTEQQHHRRGRGRPHRADRHARRRRREDQHRAPDDEAPDADRLDAAAAHARGEGGLRPRARGQGVAAAGGGQGEGGDGLPPSRSPRPPTRTGGWRRASTSARSCWWCEPCLGLCVAAQSRCTGSTIGLAI